MDTSTHLTMGLGLAGLAYLDPAVSTSPELAGAVLLGTILGSNAPDFDYVFKLKGKGAYYRHHRGLSHSLPALPLWALGISSFIWVVQQNVNFLHLFAWTLLAVVLHVLFDLFNVYGTQVGHPFTQKWLALNCIPLFDPFIMFLHVIGFVGWYLGFSPGLTFLLIYILIVIYLVERYYSMKRTLSFLKKECNIKGHYSLVPTMSWTNWGVVIDHESTYYVGMISKKQITMKHSFLKDTTNQRLILRAQQDSNVQNFLSSIPFAHVLVFNHPNGYEVRWFDLRFRKRDHYPRMAVVQLDRNLKIKASYTGWLHQTNRIERKLTI